MSSFIDDMFGNFTGSKSRQDLQAGKTKADADLKTGYDTGRADIDTGIGRFNDYAAGGQTGFDSYLASLGLKGPGAAKTVADQYNSNPEYNAIMDRTTRANTRQFTGMGMGNSGAATQSLTNRLLDQWGAYQDRLKGVGDTGMTATGQQAGLDKSKGDMSYGYGATQAGNDINYSNAIAKSRDTGINNLFSVIGTGVKGYAAATGTGRVAV